MITKHFSKDWTAWPGLALVLTLAGCASSGSSAASAPATTGTATASVTASASGTASAGGTGAASTAADTVVIKNFMFGPMTLPVSPGAVVTVHNEDSVTHTLTDQADPKLFSTGDVGPGQTKTFKAPAKAGSYAFICSIHQYMTGTLVVR